MDTISLKLGTIVTSMIVEREGGREGDVETADKSDDDTKITYLGAGLAFDDYATTELRRGVGK